MNIANLFKASDQPESLGSKFRNIRFNYFKQKIGKLPKPLRILDVGGLESFWENHGFAGNPDYIITILNIEHQPVSYTNMKHLLGNATNLNTMANNEFDVVFSNSVIEHLYTWDNQLKMAAEVQRVGKYHFIQTPNKHFIIEPHYLLPFFQYLPRKWQYPIITKTKLSRLQKWDEAFASQYVNEIRLISHREMRLLFPQSVLYLEKITGLVKSFTAHNFL